MQGTGRNWLSSVLCRLWRGHVASSFDLAGTLRTGYNGPLSQKLLAIVDEINEGGSNARWDNAEVLKSLVTGEALRAAALCVQASPGSARRLREIGKSHGRGTGKLHPLPASFQSASRY